MLSSRRSSRSRQPVVGRQIRSSLARYSTTHPDVVASSAQAGVSRKNRRSTGAFYNSDDDDQQSLDEESESGAESEAESDDEPEADREVADHEVIDDDSDDQDDQIDKGKGKANVKAKGNAKLIRKGLFDALFEGVCEESFVQTELVEMENRGSGANRDTRDITLANIYLALGTLLTDDSSQTHLVGGVYYKSGEFKDEHIAKMYEKLSMYDPSFYGIRLGETRVVVGGKGGVVVDSKHDRFEVSYGRHGEHEELSLSDVLKYGNKDCIHQRRSDEVRHLPLFLLGNIKYPPKQSRGH